MDAAESLREPEQGEFDVELATARIEPSWHKHVRIAIHVLGYTSTLACIVLGVSQVIFSGARLGWPPVGEVVSDVNKETWRMRLFSLTPDVFVDTWTPLLTGILASSFYWGKLRIIHSTYMNYTLFLVLQALFGIIGYLGAVGIIFGCITLLAALLSLFSSVMHIQGPPVPTGSVSKVVEKVDLRRRRESGAQYRACVIPLAVKY